MKLTKSIPDPVRRTLVKTSSAICKPIEARLESSGRWENAQKFRKLQHQLIGLTEDQWQYFSEYFRCEEVVHLVTQAHERVLNAYNERRRPSPDGLAEMDRYKKQRGDLERSLRKYRDDIRAAEGVMNLLKRKMGHTPLYRAMTSRQRDLDGHLRDWLQGRCAANGGCCARSCGCCEKLRGTTSSRGRFGHCTLLCDCCARYKGYRLEVKAYRSIYPDGLVPREVKRYLHMRLQYEGQVKLNPKETKDTNSALLMDAYVWGLHPGRKEGSDGQAD
jgi:hypothetical protein